MVDIENITKGISQIFDTTISNIRSLQNINLSEKDRRDTVINTNVKFNSIPYTFRAILTALTKENHPLVDSWNSKFEIVRRTYNKTSRNLRYHLDKLISVKSKPGRRTEEMRNVLDNYPTRVRTLVENLLDTVESIKKTTLQDLSNIILNANTTTMPQQLT